MANHRWRRLWTIVPVLLLTAGCEIPPPPMPPQRTPATPDAVASCSHPTDTTRTDRGERVGSLLEPTIGPISFHIDKYSDERPTKVIIRPKNQLTKPVVLTGSRCSDGLPLLFWFQEGRPGRPTAGDPRVTLEPAAAGVSYTGYLLFTAKGRWQVTVVQANTQLGVLLIETV